MDNLISIIGATWPIAVGFITLVVVLAKMHYAIEIQNEKIKTLFELVNKLHERLEK
jgi:hypothetical protein